MIKLYLLRYQKESFYGLHKNVSDAIKKSE